MVSSDNCSIAYRIDGPVHAPVLLLSNSLGTTMDMWAPQIAAFSQFFKTVRYDSRGHGGSQVPSGSYTIERLGRDALDLADALEIDSFAFCGLSMGGLVGQWLAIHHSARVRALVLANTAARIGVATNWNRRIETVSSDGTQAIADEVIARFYSSGFVSANPDLVDDMRHMICAISPKGYGGCCAAIRDADFRDLLSAVTTPTLVLAAERDVSTTLAEGRFLHQSISGSRFAQLDAAHLSNVERSNEFNALVLRFLTEAISH
ncbi:3-oxoadipate enol-lactonase [Sphingobium sp. MK2]|uniref:3-oxoadipate enol-lactonase n=1 Tax=Sphingobium sp. MK2 TaxID=3116540 RepID=UPI0032E3652D